MGIVQSHMERRRERLLNQCETLNQNIFHLQAIEKNTKNNKGIEKKKKECEKSFNQIEKVIKKRKQEYIKTKDVKNVRYVWREKLIVY